MYFGTDIPRTKLSEPSLATYSLRWCNDRLNPPRYATHCQLTEHPLFVRPSPGKLAHHGSRSKPGLFVGAERFVCGIGKKVVHTCIDLAPIDRVIEDDLKVVLHGHRADSTLQ